MPPVPILDLAELDFGRVLYTHDQIYRLLPQRHEFAQLDAIIHLDVESKVVAGYRNVRDDEWWCRGHMPGKPIFPGILMVECAAQLGAFATHFVLPEQEGFMGFGGIDGAKFRDAVVPPTQILFVCRGLDVRRRRTICENQAYVDGKMVFEGTITGLQLKQ